jgi:hypothetical protein
MPDDFTPIVKRHATLQKSPRTIRKLSSTAVKLVGKRKLYGQLAANKAIVQRAAHIIPQSVEMVTQCKRFLLALLTEQGWSGTSAGSMLTRGARVLSG